MNVLVTGATGFIGSHLVERLLGTGARVRALVRRETDATALDARGVEVLRGDVRDPDAVRRAMADREVVYHLAKAPAGSPARLLRAVNAEGTRNIAQAAARAGVARLVHASTAAVYGGVIRGLAVHEDVPLRPDSAYARSKALAEQALRSACDSGPVVVAARISSVLGPGAKAWRSLFAAVEARRFRMIGAGTNHHHLADVSDIVEGLLLCATTPGIDSRAYNLAGSEAIRLRDLIQFIGEELGVSGEPARAFPAGPLRMYRRLGDALSRVAGVGLPRADGIGYLMSDRVLDITRARRELGYAPRISQHEAIRRTAHWYRNRSTPPERDDAEASAPR